MFSYSTPQSEGPLSETKVPPSTVETVSSLKLTNLPVQMVKHYFETYRTNLVCIHCKQGRNLNNDGITNGTFRLRCGSQACRGPNNKKGKTFNAVESLKLYQTQLRSTLTDPDVDLASSETQHTDDSMESPVMTPKRPRRSNDSITTATATTTTTMKTLNQQLAWTSMAESIKQILSIIEEQNKTITELSYSINMLKQQQQQQHYEEDTNKTNKNTRISYASVASLHAGESQATKMELEVSTKKNNKLNEMPNPKAAIRLLTGEEMNAIKNGRPLQRRTKLATAYFTGIRRTRITTVKSFMHTAEINLSKVYHIGFIGKSVTEVHIDESYLEAFTRKIEVVECHILKDFDPLSPNNFKLTEFIALPFEKQLQKAANLYKKRLENQQKNSPETMYRLRKYLGSKLSNLQSQSLDTNVNTNTNMNHVTDKETTQILMNNKNEITMNETNDTTTITAINCLVDTCIPLLNTLEDFSKSFDNDNDRKNQEIGQHDHSIETTDDEDLPLSIHPQKKYQYNQQEMENTNMYFNTESEDRNKPTRPETVDLTALSVLNENCKCESCKCESCNSTGNSNSDMNANTNMNTNTNTNTNMDNDKKTIEPEHTENLFHDIC
jgi:ribosomal protein L24